MTVVAPPDFSQVMAHEMVAHVAKEMAGEVYDTWAKSSNVWYRQHKSRDKYIGESWGLYVEAARATLASMLAQPSTPELLKEQIHDALVKDHSVRRGRTLQVQVN